MYSTLFCRQTDFGILRQPLCGMIAIGFLSCGAALADEEPKSASDQASKTKTVKISGVFEAIKSIEITPDTEQITSLEIKRIVPHGSTIEEGKNVVLFETEEIDKQIKEAEIELRLAQLKLDDDEYAHEQFLETQKLDRAAAELARKKAQQDYDNFVQVDRERQIKSAAYNLKSSQSTLENAKEELEQLEQMYKEDDLTEESEEIVLKRAKQSVEFAEYRLEGTEIQSERAVKQGVPRSEAQQEDSLARAELTYQKAIRNLASARRRAEIEIGRKRDKFNDQKEKLEEHKQERKRVALASSIDGIVLHGKLTRGKLSDKASLWESGSKATAKQVLATVVSPKALQIRLTLEEKDLHVASVGAKCKITAKAFPGFETQGSVKSVSTVPFAGTKYDAVVTFRRSKNNPDIMPTMTCDLHFEVADEEDSASAATDDEDAEEAPTGKAKKEGAKKREKQAKNSDSGAVADEN